jgi:hypothetical protein
MNDKKGVLHIVAIIAALVVLVGLASVFFLNPDDFVPEQKMTLEHNQTLLSSYWDSCPSKLGYVTYDGCLIQSEGRSNAQVTCVFDGANFRTLYNCQ